MKKVIHFKEDTLRVALEAVQVADKFILEEINKFTDCNIAFQAQIYQMAAEMFFAMCRTTANPLGISKLHLKQQKQQFFRNSKAMESFLISEIVETKKE